MIRNIDSEPDKYCQTCIKQLSTKGVYITESRYLEIHKNAKQQKIKDGAVEGVFNRTGTEVDCGDSTQDSLPGDDQPSNTNDISAKQHMTQEKVANNAEEVDCVDAGRDDNIQCSPHFDTESLVKNEDSKQSMLMSKKEEFDCDTNRMVQSSQIPTDTSAKQSRATGKELTNTSNVSSNTSVSQDNEDLTPADPTRKLKEDKESQGAGHRGVARKVNMQEKILFQQISSSPDNSCDISADSEAGSEAESEQARQVHTSRHKKRSDLPPVYREHLLVDHSWKFSSGESTDALSCDDHRNAPSTSPWQKPPHISDAQTKSQNRRHQVTDTSSEESHFSLVKKY